MSTLNIQLLCRRSIDFPELEIFSSPPGTMINLHWLALPMARTLFHGPKGVPAIEVRLYMSTNREYPDQTAWMCVLIWIFAVCIWHKGLFPMLGIIYFLWKNKKNDRYMYIENIVEKRRNCSIGAISPLFHNIFYMLLDFHVLVGKKCFIRIYGCVCGKWKIVIKADCFLFQWNDKYRCWEAGLR